MLALFVLYGNETVMNEPAFDLIKKFIRNNEYLWVKIDKEGELHTVYDPDFDELPRPLTGYIRTHYNVVMEGEGVIQFYEFFPMSYETLTVDSFITG